MTTLSANAPRAYELGDINDVGIIASDIVYEGAAVGENGSGYGRPLVAGDLFLGFALEKVDNASGSAGDKDIRVRRKGRIQLSISGLAIGDIGKPVFASDDNTFTLTAGSNSWIGQVVRFVETGVGIVAFDADQAMEHPNLVMTVGAEAADAINVAVQVNPRVALSGRWYLSSDNAGQALASAPDGGIAVGTDGVITEDTDNVQGKFTSEADGDLDLTLTHAATGGDTFYLNLVGPDGIVHTSGAITFA